MNPDLKKLYLLEPKAIQFVATHHSPSQRYGAYPYIVHLYQVVSVSKEFGFGDTPAVVLGCWLHDVMEDAAVNYGHVERDFGTDVAEIVYTVTDEKGRDRKERHDKTYPGIRANPLAVVVKLCDRLANIRYSVVTESDIAQKYIDEFAEFKAALYDADACATDDRLRALWSEVETWHGATV
jgi:(p)ppGpp synthase/HD superfamily hydrolase